MQEAKFIHSSNVIFSKIEIKTHSSQIKLNSNSFHP